MAAIAIGAATPPPVTEPPPSTTLPTDTSALKRKCDDAADSTAHDNQDTTPNRSKQIQRDVLDLLHQHDTTPSFLRHEISDEQDSSAPVQKKARLSSSTFKTTILDKLAAGGYASLALLADDAARVSKEIESAIRIRPRDGESRDGGRLPVDDLKQIQRVKAFEQLVKEVVEIGGQYLAVRNTGATKAVGKMVNGDQAPVKDGMSGRSGSVLTLFGNAPTPKQLFSSMQKSPSNKRDTVIKSELPVEEMSLPNGLTATNILSAPMTESEKRPTFEETFTPSYSLPTLQPPKARKRSSTRDTVLSWAFKDPINRGSKKGGYTVQSLATGEWLNYGGLDASSDSAAALERRKQRDRALSSGADVARKAASEASVAEQQAREEEALFRRAYSSFAPSHDNAKAIIPAETKGMLRWHKVGAQRFRDTFALDPALMEEQPVAAITSNADKETALVDDVALEKVLEDLDGLESEAKIVQRVTAKTDVDRVLHEVSELLETLASHQRIRSATLWSSTAASRTPISPAPALAAKVGRPDEPAEDEVSIYQALRREIAYLVLKLPPYAVAKLEGDQLAELGVSPLIAIQTKNVRGIMEEDHVARLAKHNAMATAAGIASLTRSTSSTSGQHYNTTAQRTPAIGQAANTRYGASSLFGTTRTPSTQPQYHRSTSNQSSYGTPGATVSRPGYGQQPNQYTRPTLPQHNNYNQPNGQHQYYQQRQTSGTTPGYYSTGGPQYPQAPALVQQSRPTYSPSSSHHLQQFQQRSASHTAAANAVAYQSNTGNQQVRMSSPANVQPRPVYAAQYSAQQPQYPSSGRANPTAFTASKPTTPANTNGHARLPPQQQQQQQMAPPKASGTPQQVNKAEM
ncbi:hypothetical protein LTR35_000147 [Friedmanniomyces endolithicus]|uniref:Uncharacterized protein n=1 Tax=Friedmanniomyces endolithicus TaxID=329885 RepID=A0AAN6J782_9PEZI|nr:hypothetical protein LTS00_008790 [Friedmanniomyces endolithicus]KAK0293543.1 hypothetical protein LTR35_000147 [Friedmanniomyces endolithicus]KAK0318881.1 hypothetical protein LTR82_009981 [Friedmanniomyces endolithicus]KAK0997315.1 hypothetical protein LTR54_009775 [Friedmanniomyces endolithicus]